jgi:hypothetical protein
MRTRLNLSSILISEPQALRYARNGSTSIGWLLFAGCLFLMWVYFASQFAEAFAGAFDAISHGFIKIFYQPV